jgi:probable rRNA maturation factor
MILNRQRRIRVARQPLESFLRKVRRELKLKTSDVTVCFVTDAEIARMNRTFRSKKGPTDVLSFPTSTQRAAHSRTLGKRPGRTRRSRQGRIVSEREYLGDVAISPSTAWRNARRDGRTLVNELKVLILHGVLHLLGYDHETDRGEMDRLEQELRHRLGLT